jgi:hypothetical protein
VSNPQQQAQQQKNQQPPPSPSQGSPQWRAPVSEVRLVNPTQLAGAMATSLITGKTPNYSQHQRGVDAMELHPAGVLVRLAERTVILPYAALSLVVMAEGA